MKVAYLEVQVLVQLPRGALLLQDRVVFREVRVSDLQKSRRALAKVEKGVDGLAVLCRDGPKPILQP